MNSPRESAPIDHAESIVNVLRDGAYVLDANRNRVFVNDRLREVTGFDGDNNFSGRWNHDENRFWADYVAGAEYIYDDEGNEGGLDEDASYVLLGDMDAGPGDEPLDPATKYFVDNDDFDGRSRPTSPGGAQRGNPYATAEFGGGTTVDWVLPSPDLSKRALSVVWPSSNANKRGLSDAVAEASDHRLVWADIAAGPGSSGRGRGRGNR